MRLVVDGAVCMGHGRCYGLVPELIECDDEGYPTLRDVPIDVPGDLVSFADEAAGTCPEEAIRLIDD